MAYTPGMNGIHQVGIPYSGKNRWALNLAISAKTPYFFNSASFIFGDLGP